MIAENWLTSSTDGVMARLALSVPTQEGCGSALLAWLDGRVISGCLVALPGRRGRRSSRVPSRRRQSLRRREIWRGRPLWVLPR
ncbi:MAG: hypothetical protein ACLP01_12670 [Solirubrobacteraceae bacterium]